MGLDASALKILAIECVVALDRHASMAQTARSVHHSVSTVIAFGVQPGPSVKTLLKERDVFVSDLILAA